MSPIESSGSGSQTVAGDLLSQTTLTWAQQQNLANSKFQVQQLNAKLIAQYHQAYADYVANMQSGQNVPEERRHAPKPPNGWELAPPDADGIVFYQMGTTPVCAAGPDVTANFDNSVPVKTPNHMSINWKSRQGKWVTALLDDGMPGGFSTPPIIDEENPTAPPHTYQRFTTAVGPGWYLQTD